MNDLAMQNSRPSCRTNVRELPVIWLGHWHRANLPSAQGVFLHPIKVDVRLVSFPCSAFEMIWLQKQGRWTRSCSPLRL
jgi:hypothetical protein